MFNILTHKACFNKYNNGGVSIMCGSVFICIFLLSPFYSFLNWAKRDVQLKKLAFVDATFVCSLTQHTKAKSTVLK